MNKFNKVFLLLAVAAGMLFSNSVLADSAAEIDAAADEALVVFKEKIDGADIFLTQSAGYLIFPRVIKAGFVIGGETGEGALRVGGKTAMYVAVGGRLAGIVAVADPIKPTSADAISVAWINWIPQIPWMKRRSTPSHSLYCACRYLTIAWDSVSSTVSCPL